MSAALLRSSVALILAFSMTPALALPQLDLQSTSVLKRAASSLPKAEPGTWKEWVAGEAPPLELRPALSLGSRAYAGGNLPSALGHYWSVLEQAPDYPPLLHQVGVLYFRLRRYGDSAELFERFLLHAPTQIGGTRALGHCYYSLGRYEEARTHYHAVLKAAPDQVEALRGLALTEARLGNLALALAGLERVLELAPEHVEAMTWRAQILYDDEQLEQALEVALRARELAPYEPRPEFLLSRIYFELEREEEARAATTRFEVLDRVAQEARFIEAKLLYEPGRAELWMQLVRVRASVSDVERTRAALQQLIQLDPRNHRSAIFALDTLESLGDEQGAAVAAKTLETNCAHIADSWKRLEAYYGKRRDRARQVQAGETYLRLRAEQDG